MSSVIMRNNAIAYTKGVNAGLSKTGYKCPYGDSKRALLEWFWLGFDDARNKRVDNNMVIENV